MVLRVYQAVLRLYPAGYRAVFAREMVETFRQAMEQARKRGHLTFVAFVTCELAGLLNGAFTEWMAKWTAREAYLTSRRARREVLELPSDVVAIQGHIDHVLRSMEFAIAHHDFPKARFYSDQERIARTLLERLLRQNELEPAP